MPLRDAFTTEMKAAMKGGDKPRLATIRLIQAALKDRDIENRGAGKEPLADDEILALLQKMVKQRAESIAIFDANGRPELAAAEREEVAVITSFLPRQLDEAETETAVADAIAVTGAASIKDMGRVVAKLRSDHAGRMDFARAAAVVKAKLAG